jgi:hypothetical protein
VALILRGGPEAAAFEPVYRARANAP